MVKDGIQSAITVSLEWAKKLKEAGLEQGITIGNWRPSTNDFYRKQQQYEIHFTSGSYRNEKSFDAPTAEEILRRLPEAIKYPVRNAIEYELFIRPFDDLDERHWEVIYAKDIDNVDNTPLHETTGTLANAAAAMYCYLADNKLLP